MILHASDGHVFTLSLYIILQKLTYDSIHESARSTPQRASWCIRYKPPRCESTTTVHSPPHNSGFLSAVVQRVNQKERAEKPLDKEASQAYRKGTCASLVQQGSLRKQKYISCIIDRLSLLLAGQQRSRWNTFMSVCACHVDTQRRRCSGVHQFQPPMPDVMQKLQHVGRPNTCSQIAGPTNNVILPHICERESTSLAMKTGNTCPGRT